MKKVCSIVGKMNIWQQFVACIIFGATLGFIITSFIPFKEIAEREIQLDKIQQDKEFQTQVRTKVINTTYSEEEIKYGQYDVHDYKRGFLSIERDNSHWNVVYVEVLPSANCLACGPTEMKSIYLKFEIRTVLKDNVEEYPIRIVTIKVKQGDYIPMLNNTGFEIQSLNCQNIVIFERTDVVNQDYIVHTEIDDIKTWKSYHGR